MTTPIKGLYIGTVDCTYAYGKFKDKFPEADIDGRFEGREKGQYKNAIDHLRIKGKITKKQADLFKALIISNEGPCYGKEQADDIYLALYEELTNYIESFKNKKFLEKSSIGRALVALQADVSRRVRSRGYELKKSPRGTAGEVPLSKPFPVNKQTWKYAIRADSPLIFRPNGTCYFNHNVPEGKSESENEENKQPHPVYKKNGEDYSTRKIVQTDTRFPRGKDPIEYLAYLAADGKTELPGDPLDASDLGSDWD